MAVATTKYLPSPRLASRVPLDPSSPKRVLLTSAPGGDGDGGRGGVSSGGGGNYSHCYY